MALSGPFWFSQALSLALSDPLLPSLALSGSLMLSLALSEALSLALYGPLSGAGIFF